MRKCSRWCLLFLLCAPVVLAAAETTTFRPKPHDWPQWQGPERTTISRETGLLASWPKQGPPLRWKAHGLGGGYSTPSVAAGRILGMSFRDDDEIVWALAEDTGNPLWSTRIAKANRNVGSGEGSRCTPTVDGELLYALGVSGDLVCLETATGKERWHKNLPKDFQGRMMSGWGYSESPLVDGSKVLATPGGKKATLVALDKKNGETIWTAQVPQGDGAGYASIIAADVDGQRQYIQFLGGGVVGIAAADGKFLWRYDKPHNGTANCSTPIAYDNCVFAASNYGTGGGLAKLSRHGTETTAAEVYFTKHMKNHHGGMVLVDGYLYGSDGRLLTCLDFKTGNVMWEDSHPGKGSIAYADGHLYYRNEGGPIVLVEANPKKYVEQGRFSQPDRSDHSAWPHPVVANGKLYIRDQDLLLCYDVKQP
jgi:prepilin-type processing-associated H-X9-DG protein